MPKHKIRNTFYRITWEVNTVNETKKIIKKFYKNCVRLENSSKPFCVCKELSTTSIGKHIFEASSIY